MSPIERVHYAAEPVVLDRSEEYALEAPRFKPNGLWYSAPCGGEDVGWEQWSRSEEFNVGALAVRHVLELDLSRILVLSTRDDVIRFAREFGSGPEGHARPSEIDWQRVAERYAGVEIAPYRYDDLRYSLGFTWYYAWDCSSGVVWDLSAVTSFRVETGAAV